MASVRTQQGMMMGPMKGHLAPNSSPFKPTRNKLSSQYMIQDHMASHYNKLLTVRPAIDNKPPKSMMTSVKKRDQIKREVLAKQMKLSDFEREMKYTNSPARTPEPRSDGTYRSFSLKLPKNGYDEVRPQSSMSLYSYRSGTFSQQTSRPFTATDQGSPRTKGDVLNKTYAGDYLDRHEERFKNVNEPFTPRLKKRSGKSVLAHSKHYAPPLKLNKEVTRKTACGQNSKLKSKSSLSEASDRTMTKESEDRNWVEDKSELMQRLTLDNSVEANDRVTPKTSASLQHARPGSAIGLFYGNSNLGESYLESRSDAVTYETRSRIHAEDDEMKYLEFINRVTNDILTRGVYSDRVLTKLMERHLEENRGRLNEDRMRRALIKLQADLGISPSASSLYDPTSRGRSKTPQYSPSRGGSRKSSLSAPIHKKKSPRSAASRRRREDLAAGHTSGSETSNSEGRRSVTKGILKNPSDGRSSGSDPELRSNLSSGADQSRIKKNKNSDTHPEATYDHDTVVKTVFSAERESLSSNNLCSTEKINKSGEHELPSSGEGRDVNRKTSLVNEDRESLHDEDVFDEDF